MERIEKSFADFEYESKKRRTRREKFLKQLEVLIPWGKLMEQLRPYYPSAAKWRVHYPLEGMLWVHCVQLCYKDLAVAWHIAMENGGTLILLCEADVWL
ncbi:MAG TPA: hypothetical protein DD643_06325 [Synechococcus sp. UBA8638]|nr:hypothetical protein [Synechococcus sp. UBA8638]